MKDLSSGKFIDGWQGIKVCRNCNKDFIATSGSRRFCDDCILKLSICPECGREKNIYHKFCGNSCAGKWKFRNYQKVKEGLLIGRYHPNRIQKLSERMKLTRGIPKLYMRGENNPNWKGGHSLRPRNLDYFRWVKSVFERDYYICQVCGKRGGKLEAHHIKSWKEFPELRFDINNGKTVCEKFCHRKVLHNLDMSLMAGRKRG